MSNKPTADSEQTADYGLLTGVCPSCGRMSHGTFDPFFRQVELECRICGHAWTKPLTNKERWDLVHEP